MPRILRHHNYTTPLFVIGLFVVLMSLPGRHKSFFNFLQPTVSAATTLTVNSTGDGADNNPGDGVCNDGTGICTLRAAIQEANALAGDDLIVFSASLQGSVIALNSALPDISEGLNIVGPGASLLTVRRSSAAGTPSFRVFTTQAFLNIKLSGLTISNGHASQGDDGGAILNQNNTALTLTGVILTGNSTDDGTLIRAGFGGAIYNRGTINLINSSVQGNFTGKGSSSGPPKGGNGGGIYNSGSATLNVFNSVISGNATGNTLSSSGTDGDGGGIYNAGTAILKNTTISGNTTSTGTNGRGGQGAGINNAIGGTLALSNSTVVNNIASSGVGGSVGGGISGGTGGSGSLANTLVANNNAGNGKDLAGFFNSQDFNLIRDPVGADFAGTTTHNITGQDPLLGPLASNGGPTQTHALLAGSPALDAGGNANIPADTFDLDGDTNTTEPVPYDQRGPGFLRVVDGPDADATATVDIGAFEVQGSSGTTLSFAAASFNTTESSGSITITVQRIGDTSQPVIVNYATIENSITVQPCATVNGFASSRCDFTSAVGTLRFAAGETSKIFDVLISQDNYVEGPETLTLTLSQPTGGASLASPSTATLTIADDATEPIGNPIDVASVFVRQHYHDFLNREPDASGLAFWTNQITECQQLGATCDAAVRRINVSAAFFLSIEFQETGYLVERLYKVSYGDALGTSNLGPTDQMVVPTVRLNEFLPDTQEIGRGVVVGQTGWEQVLENNKIAFTLNFVERSRFMTALPPSLSPGDYVDTLFSNAGVFPSQAERNAVIAEFGGSLSSSYPPARARALRRVAENALLNQKEKNKAFVLMQYFGYLRRNPNDPRDTDYTGYDFWLTKLTEHNGNYIEAEMVKAFLDSTEYRARFGP
jgi:CSLREA domain-containing protein